MMTHGDAMLLVGTCGCAQSRKGLRIVLKKAGNGNRYGTRSDGLPVCAKLAVGYDITMDANFAEPSGWLGGLGVRNPDSIAALAERRHSGLEETVNILRPSLRLCACLTSRPDD